MEPSAFKGQLTLVNVFGSWCVPCRAEHPLLMQLAKDKRFRIAGLNYKDKDENALKFLGELGNPFDMIGVDA
ncbi:UNVERIFIED_CONTAM: redoxin family protein, partial [Salmonella enterica subsp. enterica serovar Enteritidis]